MKMIQSKIVRYACVASAFLLPIAPALATTALDPAGDFLGSYTGVRNPGLDVLSIGVNFNGTNFLLNSVLAGAPFTGGSYVWGVDRGGGTARFVGANPGLDRVLFDTVIVVTFNGGAWGGIVNLLNGSAPTALAAGSVFVDANSMSILVPGALLPTTGSALDRYGFNLWPRDRLVGGFAGISDFAPNNGTLAARVPEPATWGMMLSGFGIAGFAARRRKRFPRVLA
jgi:hypothetical protein